MKKLESLKNELFDDVISLKDLGSVFGAVQESTQNQSTGVCDVLFRTGTTAANADEPVSRNTGKVADAYTSETATICRNDRDVDESSDYGALGTGLDMGLQEITSSDICLA